MSDNRTPTPRDKDMTSSLLLTVSTELSLLSYAGSSQQSSMPPQIRCPAPLSLPAGCQLLSQAIMHSSIQIM